MIEPNMATMLAFIVTDLDATHAYFKNASPKPMHKRSIAYLSMAT